MLTLAEEISEFQNDMELARLNIAYALQPDPIRFERKTVTVQTSAAPYPAVYEVPEPQRMSYANQPMALTAWRPYP